MASWHGDDNEKKSIVKSLDFEGIILAHCAKFGLKELDRKIGDAQLSGKCRMPTSKINNIIGYQMARIVDRFYSKFALRHHFPVRNLTFEVDNPEMISYLKSGHNAFLKYGKQKDVHTIADCIANANYHRWKVSPKVIEYPSDFEERFHSSVLDSINKK
jgi:hypothetical protein